MKEKKDAQNFEILGRSTKKSSSIFLLLHGQKYVIIRRGGIGYPWKTFHLPFYFEFRTKHLFLGRIRGRHTYLIKRRKGNK